jgi:ADP-ribose pyrophosphatase
MAKRSSSKAKNPIAKLVSSKKVYSGPVFWITSDQVIEPGGIKARRDIVHHTGSVVILAVDESGPEPHLLLERQYRHAVKDYLWELPAGRIDEGESELAAAKRELLEETGYTAKSWHRILKFYVSPGFLDEYMAVYLARQLRAGTAQPEADEKIEQRLVPLSDAVDMALSGKIRDAKTLASVLWFKNQSG